MILRITAPQAFHKSIRAEICEIFGEQIRILFLLDSFQGRIS